MGIERLPNCYRSIHVAHGENTYGIMGFTQSSKLLLISRLAILDYHFEGCLLKDLDRFGINGNDHFFYILGAEK